MQRISKVLNCIDQAVSIVPSLRLLLLRRRRRAGGALLLFHLGLLLRPLLLACGARVASLIAASRIRMTVAVLE
jgi:hypothetical protein